MTRPFDVARYMDNLREVIEAALNPVFSPSDPPEVLFAAMRYSLLGSGKRLRPLLCLATAEAFDITPGDALPAALALELVHCYSLIHDDLPAMDDDDLRRGKPTNHKVYGEATALLAGDGLLTHAFELISGEMRVAPERQLQMIRRLAHAAGPYGMVGGQQADLLAEHKDGTVQELEFIHQHKTGALIQAAVVIGGLFADVPLAQRKALENYGAFIGLAFQMMDDYLDVVGTTEALGKTKGSDLRLEKFTYPRLVGLEETRTRAIAAVDAAEDELIKAGIDSPQLRAIARFIVSREH
ncbi:polyprenyl synthetase family protein [Alicyclobacillus curvatus]|jgi:geranylgeranyl diphosphate synthase, type II|nr:polyprenyl synthetase family protein [Alicyclobacillus curvatus]